MARSKAYNVDPHPLFAVPDEFGSLPTYVVVREHNLVFFKPQTTWQRQAIIANGYKLWADGIYERELKQNSIGEYIARTIAQGGIG